MYLYQTIKKNIKREEKNVKNEEKESILKKKKIKTKLKTTKGFIHDVNTIKCSINNINKKYNYKITLIRDKDYITSKVFKFKKKDINLITLNKKNQVNKNKNNNIIKIRKRKIIENTIACLKKNERVMTRKDHKLKSFMGWLYITSLLHNININKKYNSI